MRYLAIMLAALLAAGAQAAPLASYLATAEAAPLSRPGSWLPFTFNTQAGEDATLEVPLGEDAGMPFMEQPLQRYLLRILPRDRSHRVAVRHRALIYMNVSDEGPHYAIPATERRGAWRPATRRSPHTFEVGGLPAPSLQLRQAQLLAAVKRSVAGRDRHWLDLARQCKGPDHGPCYTVTDTEYEVTVSKHGRLLSRGVLRLRQPNGC